MSKDSEGMKNEESDDDDELDDDDAEGEEDEDEIDDSRDDSVDDAPSPFFPSGSIEQNPAISVNVQVLSPCAAMVEAVATASFNSRWRLHWKSRMAPMLSPAIRMALTGARITPGHW